MSELEELEGVPAWEVYCPESDTSHGIYMGKELAYSHAQLIACNTYKPKGSIHIDKGGNNYVMFECELYGPTKLILKPKTVYK